MANRSLVNKLRASRRKAYLNSPRTLHVPNWDVVKEYKARGRSNEDSMSELDHIIRILKKAGVQLPRSAQRAGESNPVFAKLHHERPTSEAARLREAEQDSLKMAAQHGVYAMWQSWKRQGLTEFSCVKAKEDGGVKTYWFFSGSTYFFCEEDPDLGRVRLSVFYSDRDRAFRDLDRGRIHWVKSFSWLDLVTS